METNFGSLFRNRKQINFQKFQTHYFSKILENSGFEKHNPKGLEIQNLWKKSIEIKDVQTHNEWFHNFAQLFLQNYQDWKPKENEISNKFDFEQFSQAIQNDEAHPTRLIFETLRNLVFYLLHLKKSQANITNEIYQTKNNDKIEILSLEMLVILSNSRFNRAILFKYGLFDILVELGLVVYAKAFNLAKKLSLKQNLESNSRDVDNTNIDVNVDDDFDIYIYICSSINRILCFFLMNDYQFEKHVPQNIEHGNNDKINVIDREEDEEINLYDISITGKPYLSWISELFITDLLFLFTDLFNELEQKIKRTEILSQTHISLLNLLLFTFSHGLISKELTTQASNLVISQLRPPSIVYENLNENQNQNPNPNQNENQNQNQIKNQNSKYLGFEKRMIILQLLREIIVNIPDSEIAVCKNPKLYYLSDLILWVAYTFPQDWVYETINENEISLDNLNEESFNLSNPKKDYSPPSSLPKPPPLSSIQRSKTNPKINLRDFSKYLSNPFLHRLFINLSEICLHKSQKSTTDHEKKPHESRSNTISDQENQNKLQSPRIARSTSKTIKQSQNKIKYKIIEACLNIWDTRPSKKSELDPKIRLFFTFISPELQFFILELLLKVGAFDIRNILTKKTVWNILFSQAFWHSPQFENVHLSKSHSECFQSKKIFFQKFVYNTASRKDKPNLSECTCLIEMFEKYQDDLQIKHEVLDLLMKILISNPRRTKKSLVSLNFISKISAEIRRFHLIQRKYMKKDIKTSFPFDPKVFHKIRYELFDSFCVLFSIDDIRKQALGDDTTPIMLRDLLLENQTKSYSSHFISSFIREVENEQQSKFLKNFLDMITFFLHKIHKPKRKEDRNKISANSITLKNLLRLSTLCIQNKQDPLQVLFIKSGALQNVEELIKSQNSEKIDKEFIMFVVDFVQELLRNNFKSTKIFKQNFGYKKFGQLLSNYYNGNPSKDLYKTLCNMLVYKGKFHLRKNFLIQNPDIVSLIFNIFSKSSDMKLFSNILHTFLHICRKSTHNTWCCCEAGIVSIFADIFSKHSFSKIADYSVNFFSLLGSYRLTVPELKYFFRTFKNVPQQNQLIYMSLFLTGIQKMCQEESINSGAFFGFNGISSNLVIPKIDNWPSSKGYTFFTWIRVESFNDNTQNNIKYQPRIFSFLTEKGHGIELFFDPNDKDPNDKTANIVIKIATQIGEVFLHKFEEEIESKKWIFLALTQTPEKKSKIKLYIDGFCVSSIDAKSPIFQDYLSKNKIGSNYLIVSPKVDLCIYRENPFFGQMGAIYFLEDVVTDEEISTIYYSSPNLTQKKEKISRELLSNDFPNNEQNNSKLMKKIEKQKYDSKKKSTIKDLRDRENRSEGCITRKQSVKMYSISNIYSKSFLNFNSKACDLEFAYNQAVSSSINTDAKSISMFRCVTRNFPDVINCLGGIKVLFPFFVTLINNHNLNLNENLNENSNLNQNQNQNQNLNENENQNETSPQIICFKIFDLIADLVIENFTIQEDIIRSSGFSLLGQIFNLLNPGYITSDIMKVISRILNSISNEEFLSGMISHFLLRFSIWIYTYFEIQKEFFTILKEFVKEQAPPSSIISIEDVLYIARTFYYIIPETESIGEQQKKEQKHDFATGVVIGKRPNQQQILALRKNIMELISQLIEQDSSPHSIKCIIAECSLAKHKENIADLLAMLDKVFRKMPKLFPDHYMDIWLQCGFMDPFVVLLDCENAEVRENSLQILCTLDMWHLSNTTPIKKFKTWFDSENRYIAIDTILLQYSCTKRILCILFEILTGFECKWDNEKIDDLKDGTIVKLLRPSVIRTLLRFGKKYPTKIILVALQNLFKLLQNQFFNCCIFVNVNNIERFLIELIDCESIIKFEKIFSHNYFLNEEDKTNENVLNEIQEEQSITMQISDIGLEILRVVNLHHFQYNPSGARNFFYLLSTIQVYSYKDRKYQHAISRRIIYDSLVILIEFFESKSPSPDLHDTLPQPMLENMFDFIRIVHNSILFHVKMLKEKKERSSADENKNLRKIKKEVYESENENQNLNLNLNLKSNSEPNIILKLNSKLNSNSDSNLNSNLNLNLNLNSNSKNEKNFPVYTSQFDSIDTKLKLQYGKRIYTSKAKTVWEDGYIVDKVFDFLIISKLFVPKRKYKFKDKSLYPGCINSVFHLCSIVVQMPEIFGSQGFADKFQTFFTQAIPQDVPFLTRHQDEILQVFSSLFKTLSECITKEQPTKTVNNPHQVGSRNKKVTLFKQEMAKKMRLQVDPIESILLSILKTLIQQFYHFFQLIFRDSSGKQILPLKPKDSPFKVSGAHYLRDVFSQPSWDFTIEHIIFPSNGRVEQFWKNQVKFLESRLDSTLPVIKSKMNQEALDGRSSFGARYKELLTQFKNLIAQESLGISRLSEEFQKKLRFAFRKLRWMLRESMNERGVWGNPLTKEEQNSMRWKLDKTEDSCRRRRKLKPNFHFDNHLDASLDPKINPKFAQTMNQATDLNLSKDAKEKLSRVSLGMSQDPDDFLLAEDQVKNHPKSKDEDYDQNQDKEQNENDLFEKKIIIESRQCELISPLKKISGILEITNISLDFFVKQNSEFNETTSNLNIQQKMSIGNDYSWKLKDILFVYKRRYQLRQSGIEIFLKDRTNFFLNFDKKDRDKIYSKILNLVPNKQNFDISTGSAEEWFKKSDISLLWQKRLITNFDYLMLLNTIAGRTYNDISQYPIFPWVISDYESTNIDLSNPSVYRDLSKPIGALNPERFLYFKKRYETFVDPDQIVPPFYYGSHYSNAGIVVSYLVRCEPFTTLFIKLNDGKFDRADRMFHSLPETWRNCMTSTSDVKELIPEFFYFPEFLENQNNFALGKRQDKQELNDCILPKWAKSAEEFVHINRLALESEYISSNLHKWIDLIFGYKQQGEEAIRAGNLFYYLTYEKTVNIDAINDESERLAIETQIESFGQTPTQLLRRPHPRRNTREEANLPPIYFAEKNFPLLKLYFITIAKNSLIHVKFIQHSRYLSYLGIPDSVLILDRARVLGLYRWTPNDLKVQSNPFSFELDHSLSENQKSMGVTFAYDLTRFANCFEYSQSAQRLFSCGYWDDSFKLSTIESARVTQSVVRHKDVVTCLALGFNSTDHILATGSKDTTVIIWSFDMKSRSVSQTPKHVLYGHDDVVTCLAISLDLDLVISGSKDGSCIVHTVRRGRYVRSVYVSDSPVEIYLVKISPDGLFMIYSSDLLIRIFSLNGKFLKSASVSSPVLDWQLTSDASYLVTGCLDGSLLIWNFFDLVVVSNINLKSSIFSLSFSNNEQFLIAGLSDGRLAILAIELGKEK